MKGIGEKIRIQRLTKNFSQEYMAFMLDISQPAYSKLERDETEISIIRVYAIAEILEINAFELMPKPKYGTGINQHYIYRTLLKLQKSWKKRFREKKAVFVKAQKTGHSDI